MPGELKSITIVSFLENEFYLIGSVTLAVFIFQDFPGTEKG